MLLNLKMINISIKYSDFSNVFLFDFAIKLLNKLILMVSNQSGKYYTAAL